jgi:CelD/BcsL family acetyltransferase involved in cellulose biosynthesis
MPLSVRTVDDIHAVEALWGNLLKRCDEKTIFLSFEWVQAWLKVHPDVAVRIMLVETENGEAVALAPFYVYTGYRLARLIPLRVLRVLGDLDSGAEYPALITLPAYTQAACSTLFQHLASRLDWDIIWLPNCATWQQAFPVLCAAARTCSNLNMRSRRRPFSQVTLPGDMDTYIASLPKSKRTQLRRHQNKLAKENAVTYEDCERVEQLDEFLAILAELHNKHWSKKGDPGAFKRRPHFLQFCQHFLPLALQQGWLKFTVLKAEGSPKAIQLGYVYNKVFNVLQEGFDPDYIGGVGNVLRINIIAWCVEHGIVDYDFLGGLSDHKLSWGAIARDATDVFIWRRSWRTWLLSKIKMWPGGLLLR